VVEEINQFEEIARVFSGLQADDELELLVPISQCTCPKCRTPLFFSCNEGPRGGLYFEYSCPVCELEQELNEHNEQ
jgi:hypothetical protein